MRPVVVWVALLVLLAATAGSSYAPMGEWNTVVNMAISLAKALLIALFYMELARSSLRSRLAGAMALFILAMLFGLSWSDYATRPVSPAPWAQRP